MRNIIPLQKGLVAKMSHGTVQIIGDDIFYVIYDRDTVLEFEDFEETLQLYVEISKQRPMKVLVEFLQYTSASSEARKYAEEFLVDAVAAAIVFDGLAQRILVQAYQLLTKQEHPVKSFNVKQKAIDWLNSID